MANSDETDSLLTIMDEAAVALISLVKDVDRTAPALERPSVSEKIKAFEALTDYMKYRQKPTQGSGVKSKFQSMQDRFNGGSNTAKGRGGRGGKGTGGAELSDESSDDGPGGAPN